MPSPTKTQQMIERQLLQSGILVTSGRIFYVGSAVSGSADNTAHGSSPVSPFATIDFAVGQCTAARGDVIVVLPGHVETVIAAAGIALDVSGITIIGIGQGRLRPRINYTTAAAASVDVTAANITVSNIVFTPNGVSAVTAAINVTAADFALLDCEMQISTGTNACVLGILTAATAARLRVERCIFRGPATSTDTCTACIQHEVGIDFLIRDCIFHGKMTQAILNATTLLGGNIDNCRFLIYTGTKGIALAAATTAFITNNRFNVPSGTAPIVAAAGFVAGNIYSAAAGVTAGTASTI